MNTFYFVLWGNTRESRWRLLTLPWDLDCYWNNEELWRSSMKNCFMEKVKQIELSFARCAVYLANLTDLRDMHLTAWIPQYKQLKRSKLFYWDCLVTYKSLHFKHQFAIQSPPFLAWCWNLVLRVEQKLEPTQDKHYRSICLAVFIAEVLHGDKMLDGDASILLYMQSPRPSDLANTYAHT